MARLLIVHHTPSPATAELFDAVVNGACHPEITGVEVVRRAAPAATASDLLAGAVRSVESIAGGMGWRRAAPVVEVRGAPDAAARNACSEPGSLLAAAIMDDAG